MLFFLLPELDRAGWIDAGSWKHCPSVIYLPHLSPWRSWETPYRMHNSKFWGKKQHQGVQSTRVLSLPGHRKDHNGRWGMGAGGGGCRITMLVGFCIFDFHQRILTKPFFFHLCRSNVWDEKMAVSLATDVCCVWFLRFLLLLWTRNPS